MYLSIGSYHTNQTHHANFSPFTLEPLLETQGLFLPILPNLPAPKMIKKWSEAFLVTPQKRKSQPGGDV